MLLWGGKTLWCVPFLANKKARTYLMCWVRRKSRPYTCLAIALTGHATLFHLPLKDCPSMLEHWNHRMVVSIHTSVLFPVVFHEPAAISFDFLMLNHAPFAISYLRSDWPNAWMCFAFVTNWVTSSVYAATADSVALPILNPASVCSGSHSNEFRHKAISNILNMQHCHTPNCRGIGPVVCPLIWIVEYAWS
jgi:hypothetical protein